MVSRTGTKVSIDGLLHLKSSPLVSLTGEPYGCALIPRGSMFNHSCNPNLVKSYHGWVMNFSTVRQVSAGEELCLSYLKQTNIPVEDRRKTLLDHFGFLCRCVKCERELADPEFSHLSCRQVK